VISVLLIVSDTTSVFGYILVLVSCIVLAFDLLSIRKHPVASASVANSKAHQVPQPSSAAISSGTKVAEPVKTSNAGAGWYRGYWSYPIMLFCLWKFTNTQQAADPVRSVFDRQRFQSPLTYPSSLRNQNQWWQPRTLVTTPLAGVPKSTLGSTTAEYWKSTVFREVQCSVELAQWFDRTAEDGKTTAVSDFISALDHWSEQLKAVENSSTAGVDTELVTMMIAHFRGDAQFADTMRQLFNTELTSGITEISAKKVRLGIQTLNNEIAVDPAIQPLVNKLQELAADQTKQRSEIDVMRGKLSERYRGQSFPLPDDPTENSAH
jgi:hypothetical protein